MKAGYISYINPAPLPFAFIPSDHSNPAKLGITSRKQQRPLGNLQSVVEFCVKLTESLLEVSEKAEVRRENYVIRKNTTPHP